MSSRTPRSQDRVKVRPVNCDLTLESWMASTGHPKTAAMMEGQTVERAAPPMRRRRWDLVPLVLPDHADSSANATPSITCRGGGRNGAGTRGFGVSVYGLGFRV